MVDLGAYRIEFCSADFSVRYRIQFGSLPNLLGKIVLVENRKKSAGYWIYHAAKWL